MSDKPVATRDQIVWHFLELLAVRPDDVRACNWGTDIGRPSMWEIPGTDTYINGVVMEIDLDYYYGYLLELVDRETSVVSYCVVTAFHGALVDDDVLVSWDHDSSVYEGNVGTFFDRSFHTEQACAWAVGQIFGLIDSYSERKQRER